MLVWLNFLALGSDYYRTHIGLTDADGIARVSGEQLRLQFEEDRSLFLMDYRLPLEDCDDEIVLGIEGGAAFAEHRKAALAFSLVSAAAKRNWAAATNQTLSSVTARRKLSSTTPDIVSIALEVP